MEEVSLAERAIFCMTENAVDLRVPGRPMFRPWKLAQAAGASRSNIADIVTPDGEHMWLDGGPFQFISNADLNGIGVVPRIHLLQGKFDSLSLLKTFETALDPSQMRAVTHPSGPVCVIAPAGSGKTRVITERVRRQISLGLQGSAITVVAFNVRAQDEIAARLTDFPEVRVKTLHALAREVLVLHYKSLGVPRLVNELEVRNILSDIVPNLKRQGNADFLEAWVDAVAYARDTLSEPSEVEAVFSEVSAFESVICKYREFLEDMRLLDFPEMVLRACEVLLNDVDLRNRIRSEIGIIHVDEFQDLTPLLLTFVQLLTGPAEEMFAVGDDDQTIYGYSGASPRWLVEFNRYFPGSGQYVLDTNYRCPPAIVDATVALLSHNKFRVEKKIQAGGRSPNKSLGMVRAASPDSMLLEAVRQQLKDGARCREVAVLSRVNASLLAPYLLLSNSNIPCRRPVGVNENLLARNGVAALMAWVDIATCSSRPLNPSSVEQALKRPRVSATPRTLSVLCEKTSLKAMRHFAASNTNQKMRASLLQFIDHGETLQRMVDRRQTTLSILNYIIDAVGLADSLDQLDNSQRVARKSTHRDELEALRVLAQIEKSPARFLAFVRTALADAPSDPEGVTLETIHRVKGQEWPHVHIVGAVEGQMPHRLSSDLEEERRIFHVGITRCLETCTIYSDTAFEASPFLAEMLSAAAPGTPLPPNSVPSLSVVKEAVQKETNLNNPLAVKDQALFDALRVWRREVANQISKPAFTVFDDKTLRAVALARPMSLDELMRVKGVGPAKLHQYGEAVLAIIGAGTITKVEPAPAREEHRPESNSTGNSGLGTHTSRELDDPELFELLRLWRLGVANEIGKPAFVVFSDRTLKEISALKPRSLGELLNLKGVGKKKLNLYGDAVLKIVRLHTQTI